MSAEESLLALEQLVAAMQGEVISHPLDHLRWKAIFSGGMFDVCVCFFLCFFLCSIFVFFCVFLCVLLCFVFMCLYSREARTRTRRPRTAATIAREDHLETDERTKSAAEKGGTSVNFGPSTLRHSHPASLHFFWACLPLHPTAQKNNKKNKQKHKNTHTRKHAAFAAAFDAASAAVVAASAAFCFVASLLLLLFRCFVCCFAVAVAAFAGAFAAFAAALLVFAPVLAAFPCFFLLLRMFFALVLRCGLVAAS